MYGPGRDEIVQRAARNEQPLAAAIVWRRRGLIFEEARHSQEKYSRPLGGTGGAPLPSSPPPIERRCGVDSARQVFLDKISWMLETTGPSFQGFGTIGIALGDITMDRTRVVFSFDDCSLTELNVLPPALAFPRWLRPSAAVRHRHDQEARRDGIRNSSSETRPQAASASSSSLQSSRWPQVKEQDELDFALHNGPFPTTVALRSSLPEFSGRPLLQGLRINFCHQS